MTDGPEPLFNSPALPLSVSPGQRCRADAPQPGWRLL